MLNGIPKNVYLSQVLIYFDIAEMFRLRGLLKDLYLSKE